MSVAAVLARSARYLVPIAVVSAIVWAPIGWIAFGVQVPANAAQARVVLRIAWLCMAGGIGAQLFLVGALAPIVASERVSQLVALGRGVRGLVRTIVPAAIVLCAVAMGLLALAVPGVVLWTLLVLAPASDSPDVRSKLADSVRIVRARWPQVVAVVALSVGVLVAVALVLQLGLTMPLPKSPTRPQLVEYTQMVRINAIACAVVVPMSSLVLAAIRTSATRRS